MKVFRTLIIILIVTLLLFSANPVFALFGSIRSPQGVNVQSYEDRVVVRWKSPYEETKGYYAEIERAEGAGVFALLKTISLKAGAFVDPLSGLHFDVPYRYRIRSISPEQKTSKWSESGTVIIPKPVYAPIVDWNASLDRDHQGVLIAWDVTGTGERTIVIERRIDKEPFTELTRLAGNSGFFIDKAVEDKIKYIYRLYVAADDHGKQSDLSKERLVEYSVKRYAPVGSAEARITNAGLEAGGVMITWKNAQDKEKASSGNRKSVEIERKSRDSDYERLISVVDNKGKFTDTTVTAGDDVLGESDGYEVRGTVYMYRVRYSAADDFAPSPWVETLPLSYAFKYFKTPVLSIGPGSTEVSLKVSWEDVDPAQDPVGVLERKTDAGDFQEIARIKASDREAQDTAIVKGERYTYRLVWQAENGVQASLPGVSNPACAMSPEYALPNNIMIELREKANNARETVITWTPQTVDNAAAAIEIERSDNSRDFILIGKPLLREGKFVDEAVTSRNGSMRVINGRNALLNVYRYRIRVQGDDRRQPSPWHESEDLFVVGPA
jgi:hypothetical protein